MLAAIVSSVSVVSANGLPPSAGAGRAATSTKSWASTSEAAVAATGCAP
jgi:hypothetical protein